jgi:hypothetical protein
MKRLSIAVILFITVFGTASATPLIGNVDPVFAGSIHFHRQFPQATEVNYKVKGQFTEVSFTWNGLRLEAYYDQEGNPIATARDIDKNGLPVNAQLNLQKDYPDGIVAAAVEFNDTNDGLCYYVTVNTPKSTYLLHVSTSGDISVFKKMKH